MTSPTRRVRVLVVDDEALVRRGLVAILATDPRIEVVAEAGGGRQALELLRSHRVDVIVLDIQMPLMSGLEMLGRMRQDGTDVPCLFVTTFGEDDYLVEAVGLGAGGFVLKSGDPQHLLFAVHAVADGGAFFSPSLARRLVESSVATHYSRVHDARRRIQLLTPREREILGLLSGGLTNAEIAAKLRLAPGTVKVHVSSILRTTGARNRVEAALLAVRTGANDEVVAGQSRPRQTQ